MRVSPRTEPFISKSNEDYLMKERMQNESIRLNQSESKVNPRL